MTSWQMVAVATASNPFHARVIAARLGSEGIVTELRGMVDGPYPIGEIDVLVEAADEEAARELLLADEIEDAFEGVDEGEIDLRAPRELWFFLLAIVLMAAFSLARAFGSQF